MTDQTKYLHGLHGCISHLLTVNCVFWHFGVTEFWLSNLQQIKCSANSQTLLFSLFTMVKPGNDAHSDINIHTAV